MATLKELHELVHSLDKNEKKYVSIMIDALGGKARERYARSFKTLNDVKEYDADKLKKKLSANVSGMSLTEANNYVYDFICKALISYQPGNKLGYTNRLKLIEVLISKKLLDTAHKLLQDLIPELEQEGTYAQIHRSHELQEFITIQHPKINADYTFRTAFIRKRFEITAALQQNIEFLKLQYLFYKAVKEIGQPRTKADQKPYLDLWASPLLKLKPEEIDGRSTIAYYSMKVAIAAALNMPDAYQSCLDSIHDFHKRFEGKNYQNRESNLLGNLLTLMITKENIDYNELQWAKKRTREIIAVTPHKAIRQQREAKIIMAELVYFLKSKQYKKGIEYYEKAQRPAEREKWGGAILNYAIPWIAARIYYLDKNPDKALDCLLLIQDQEKTMRPNVFIDHKFLMLMCHYQLGNYSLVTSTADSLYKRLLREEKLYAPERAMLRFVKSSATIDKMKSNMKQLYNTLLELSKDPLNSSFFQYSDYLVWLNTELEKRKEKQ